MYGLKSARRLICAYIVELETPPWLEAGMLCCTIICALYLCASAVIPHTAATSKPNIIFLLTDDQDLTLGSLEYMPRLNKLLREEGMEFLNCFVPTSLCCPSRATILRGQYCHNTKVYDNGGLSNSTYLSGGYEKFVAEGLESSTIASQLKEAGYETFLLGKYMNGYGSHYTHVPDGWDHWYGMFKATDTGFDTSTMYYGASFSVDGQLLITSHDTYSTDFISNASLSLLKQRDKDQPFFMYIAPYAPHAPAIPAHRHKHLFPDITAPRNPSFNPSDAVQHQKPSWIKQLHPLNNGQISAIDRFYRNRLRCLQAVDEMLENITLFLQEEGLENNTYIFYMSDNGEHLGDFRMPGGKRQGYDTDIRVPLFVRGPGIKGGTKVSEVVMSVDLLPTWLELANTELPTSYEVDGKSMVPLLFGNIEGQPIINNFRSVALVEYQGFSSQFGPQYRYVPEYHKFRFINNTYQGVRVINGSDWGLESNWFYAEWCTGEREFYNMTVDPYQMNNMVDQVNPTLLKQLSTLTKMLVGCAGSSCVDIDFKDVALLAEEEEGMSPNLACSNPAGDSALDLDLDEGDYGVCDILIANGFPYSDSDIVPEQMKELWDFCALSNNT